MTEQLKQSLSAVVDGEADAFELRRVLDELEHDAELRATWSRYHLIGSVIRGERSAATSVVARALERRVPIAIRADASAANTPDAFAPAGSAAESAPDLRIARASDNSHDITSASVASRHPGRHARMGLGAAMVLAAIVGLLVGVAVDDVDSDKMPQVAANGQNPVDRINSDLMQTHPAASLQAQSNRAAAPATPTAGPAPESLSPAQQQRVRAYMLQHAQQQALDQRGVISLVKMATYEAP